MYTVYKNVHFSVHPSVSLAFNKVIFLFFFSSAVYRMLLLGYAREEEIRKIILKSKEIKNMLITKDKGHSSDCI